CAVDYGHWYFDVW
nr:immunoglobulin heavy chain junction region [Mus musculus]